jgi:hypothetical protein
VIPSVIHTEAIMANFRIDKTGLKHLKQHLLFKLVQAVEMEGIPEAQSYTPIWSKRLHNSAHTENPEVHENSVSVDLVFGGVSLPGETREAAIMKDVDYAIDQEYEKGFLTNSLQDVGLAIVRGLE